MPKKMRRAALRSALSVKASEGEIILMDEFKLEEVKTRNMAEALRTVAGDSTVLLLIPENSPEYEGVKRACANIANVKTLLASYLNIRDLLGYENLVMPVAALDVIESYLG
jgi:large subunit ribosomal protein L4